MYPPRPFVTSCVIFSLIVTTPPLNDPSSGNMSLRAIIKQRRQWALRATRRNEGPNVNNQRLLNIKDGVIPALLHLALQDGAVDWEIARNGTDRRTHMTLRPPPFIPFILTIICFDPSFMSRVDRRVGAVHCFLRIAEPSRHD